MRFEERNDKTPVRPYNPTAAQIDLNGNGWLGLNTARSFTTLAAKLEASYTLPLSFRIINGIDYDHRDRTGSPANTSHRNRTDQISYRSELRRSLSETVTGTLSYIHSERFGSPFLTNVKGAGDQAAGQAIHSSTLSPLLTWPTAAGTEFASYSTGTNRGAIAAVSD